VSQDLSLVVAALAECEREGQPWAEAYVAEVISLAERQGYRTEIAARWYRLLAQQADLHAALDAIGQAVAQVETLTAYCERIRRRLQK